MHRNIAAGLIIATVLSARATFGDVFSLPVGQKSLQFVTVGDSGNAADTVVISDGTTGYGAVGYVYQMGKYEVTAAQYTQFLNAVAVTDPYQIYNINMTSGCGIQRSGSSGNYSYSVISGRDNYPVNMVDWGDAARFCNWLQNGQPKGSEGPGTTETGAYTLNGDTIGSTLANVQRNPGATYFLPSDNEWYKAAYYKGGGTNAGYWLFPTQSNNPPLNTLPDTGNHANFNTGGPTPVGAFALSPSAYGTFDQGGNIIEWDESIPSIGGRGERGGKFDAFYFTMQSAVRLEDAVTEWDVDIGFRVASVPEPSSIWLMLCGVAVFVLPTLRRRR